MKRILALFSLLCLALLGAPTTPITNAVLSGTTVNSSTSVITAAAMSGTVIDVTKTLNTKSISTDTTFTFSGTPANSYQAFSLKVTNTDSASHTLTIPSSVIVGRGGSGTSVIVPASDQLLLTWLYNGSSYILYGAPPVIPLTIASGGTNATTSYGAYDNLSGAETSVASASTADIGAATTNKVSITGTTTITSFGTAAAGVQRWGRFTGALTLTYNATSLILPGSANITTAAGDSFMAVSLGSGNWVVYVYTPRNGKAVVGGYALPLRQGNNSMTVAANATVYIGYAATATGQQGRYKETIRLAGTVTSYTFSFYGSGGGANNCTVALLLNGVTTFGSTTIAGNVFPGSVTVTGLSRAVAVGDTIEVTFLNHASNASITSFIGGANVSIQ